MEEFPKNTQTAGCQEIAKQIFANPPKPPHTIRLGLEEVDNEYVFQTLLTILLEGLVIKFGSEFDINKLSPEILIHLNEYMKSIGFIITKHTGKDGCCYCNFNVNNPRIFGMDVHQVRKNEIIEREKLSEYYINLGDSQLNFDHFIN